MADLYSVLGLRKGASENEIKSAYRKLAKELHPDLNPGNKKSEHRFKEVSSAYEILSDPQKRAAYDRGEIDDKGAEKPRERPFYYETQGAQGARYSGGFSFDDLFGAEEGGFAEAFARASRGHRGPGGPTRGPAHGPSRGPARGEDELYSLEVDFRDAVLGAERVLTLPSGKNLRVKIPAGIETGQRLRMAGQGSPGPNGGPEGDVYVEIRVRASDRFKREGNDLVSETQVPFDVAILGGETRVETLDGAVMLKVPQGLTSGQRLRVRGKGVQKPGNPGDLLVTAQIRVPREEIDDELKAAIEAWRSRSQRRSPDVS